MQGINEILLEDKVDWPPKENRQEDVIPSTLYKLEVEAKMKEIIQETELNDACNEAYDELLTQEFNPEHDNFKEDVCQENHELAMVSVDKGML